MPENEERLLSRVLQNLGKEGGKEGEKEGGKEEWMYIDHRINIGHPAPSLPLFLLTYLHCPHDLAHKLHQILHRRFFDSTVSSRELNGNYLRRGKEGGREGGAQ